MQYKVLFLLYLVASTQALNFPEAPDFSNRNNAGSLRIKRDIEEEIHSIDVRKLKEKLDETFQEVKPLLENILEEAAPSIHEKISLTYLPALRSFREEVMPFFNAKVLPQVQKYYKFGLTVAEKLVEKSYKAYKMSNSTHIAVISVSDLIDEVYNELKPIIEMVRYLSIRMTIQNGHYRGKRHVSDISENFLMNDHEEIHIIDIQKLKDKLIEAYHTIKPMLEDVASEVAPSIYEKFVLTYLPKFQEIKNNVLPFLQSKIYPQVQKYIKFGMNIAEKLVDKAFKSYYLSNSTHINIVSISDIIEEVHAEMKPILDLGKYLSMRMAMNGQHYRGKRDLSEVSDTALVRNKRQTPPDFVMDMIRPFIGNIVHSITETALGGSDSIISKVALPVLYDILGDPESRYDFFRVYLIAMSAFSPLVHEMMRNQMYNTPKGTIIKVPRHLYENAMQDWQIARPIVHSLLKKHMRNVFQYMHDASKEIGDFLLWLGYRGYTDAITLKGKFMDFMHKHRSLLRSSRGDYVYYYAINEMSKELKEMRALVFKIFIQYITRNPESATTAFYYFLQKLFSIPTPQPTRRM